MVKGLIVLGLFILVVIIRRFRRRRSGPASNDDVRAQLAAGGDDGAAVRHTIHYAYPKKSLGLPAPMSAAMAVFKSHGLTVDETHVNDGITGEHQVSVADAAFDALTGTLQSELAELNWEYDGWECELVAKQQP